MSEHTAGVPDANASVSTMPKLSPPSDGAQSRSACASSDHFSSSVTRPAISMPSVSSRNGWTSSGVAPGDRQARVDADRPQSLVRAQQDGQPLALLGAAEEEQAGAGRPGARRRAGARRVRSTPFGTIR